MTFFNKKNLLRISCLSFLLLLSVSPLFAQIAQESPHPYTMEAFRQRNYSAGLIRIERSLSAKAGLTAFDITYESDGQTVYALLEKPEGNPPREGWPVIILAHGYIPPTVYSTEDSYRLVTSHYASGGFLVLKPDYRGHGRSESSLSPGHTIDYTVDVLNLMAGLDQIEGADIKNVFLYGHSMGGEIALRILSIPSPEIKGATLWAAVTVPFPENRLHYLRKRGPVRAEEYQQQLDKAIPQQLYSRVTPSNYLSDIKAPFLVHHGTADESVPFEWSRSFREQLDKAEAEYRFFSYTGQNHNIAGKFYTALNKDMEFFRSLKKGQISWPDD